MTVKPAVIPDNMPTEMAERVQPGHVMVHDPVGHSMAIRYSCSTCWAAVLNFNGNVYGSATTAPCS